MDNDKLKICVIGDGAMVGKTATTIAINQILNKHDIPIITDTNPNINNPEELTILENIKNIKITRTPPLINIAKSGQQSRRERRENERKNK